MLSSPFRKAPGEKSKFTQQSPFGNEIQFIRSSNIKESICQGSGIESFDGATIFTEQAQKPSSAEASTFQQANKSHHKNSEAIAKNDSGSDDLNVLGESSESSSILQVFAAYETGLASGTSLKLRVTPRTTAREVIDLVVKQLNMAVVLKGKEGPIYTSEQLENFCLVAVIGARERCLRDDFKPLQLQNPWKKGRLYVRQKHDLLAAIEHSHRETSLL
jgi:hypothetical protein